MSSTQVKEFFLEAKSKTVKLGRRKSAKLTMMGFAPGHKEFASNLLPTAPRTVDNSGHSLACLAKMYLNDQLGDCVCAKLGHYIGVVTGNSTSGTPYIETDAQVLKDYERIGGYVPGNSSTDQGCDPQKALDICKTQGFQNGTLLTGYTSIDGRDQSLIRQTIYLFQSMDVNISLPDPWLGVQQPKGDGFIWDVAGPSNPSNGHSILAYGYNDQGIMVSTWGMTGLITWAAVALYLVPTDQAELYAMVSPALAKVGTTVTPEGFSWSDIIKYANILGANIPAPNPSVGSILQIDTNNKVFSGYSSNYKFYHNTTGKLVVNPTTDEVSLPKGWTNRP